MLHTGEQGWVPLPSGVDGWDPSVDLRVARRVQVDPIRFAQETGVALAEVALAVSWTSSTTGMTEAVPPVSFGDQGTATVEAVLVGERLSGVLSLRTTICLVAPQPRTTVGVASIAGSVLGEEVRLLALDSQAPMFPVHEIDFGATRLSPTASWHLETGTDLLAPFYGAFRVLINTQDTELSAAVARGAKDKRQQALLDELEAGVAMLLLEIAVSLQHDLSERETWPAETVGDILGRLLDQASLKINRPSSPGELSTFRTQLAGAVRNAGRGRTFQ
ncbi:hypothetical protein ACIA5C_43150 [Actinoplanes sp. NPDC051343]|uniref:hypothetical protein n=1 Tax=Actinoplanes sp. NPDC051343 TaxID=3363906 RepID=UPI0037B9BFAB